MVQEPRSEIRRPSSRTSTAGGAGALARETFPSPPGKFPLLIHWPALFLQRFLRPVPPGRRLGQGRCRFRAMSAGLAMLAGSSSSLPPVLRMRQGNGLGA
jgi:hypothetical protein